MHEYYKKRDLRIFPLDLHLLIAILIFMVISLALIRGSENIESIFGIELCSF